jgi:TonB-dependent SusC/RagA subfamily outer membrane receptor
MKKRVLIVLLCFVGALSSAFATEKKVQGVVISSEDNLPLIGASVYVTAEDLKKAGSAQTTMGVITDVDGQFSIAIPAGITRHNNGIEHLGRCMKCYFIMFLSRNKLHFQYVISHVATKETGYPRRYSDRELTIGAVKSIDQALAGQIAGLSVSPTSGAPGAPAKIRIRGTASLNGTQDPLWVLDGIPLEGTDVPEPDELNDITNMKQSSIAGLNPADIENITILKDAAATAIYGARAANGVIVITTKKGKVGKPVINFSSRFTYTPTLSLDRLNLLNSAEKVGLEMDMIRNNYSPDNHKGGVYNILSNYNELSAFQNGGWDALSSDTQAAINRLKSVNTN